MNSKALEIVELLYLATINQSQSGNNIFPLQVASVMSLTQTCFGLGYMLGKIHEDI